MDLAEAKELSMFPGKTPTSGIHSVGGEDEPQSH